MRPSLQPIAIPPPQTGFPAVEASNREMRQEVPLPPVAIPPPVKDEPHPPQSGSNPDVRRQFSAIGTLARLNDEFAENQNFLAALVSMCEDTPIEEMRNIFKSCSFVENVILLNKLQPHEALEILDKFSSATGRAIPVGNPEALPKGMGKVLFALANKAKTCEPTSPATRSLLAALDRVAEIDGEGIGETLISGKMSDVKKVTLDGKRGFFKSCFDIGSRVRNMTSDQVCRGGFHFKNALIAERNICASLVARSLGFAGRCAKSTMAVLGSEIGLFSEEVTGCMVADISEMQMSLNEQQKISLIKQLLQMEAINAITGEMDPNFGNVKLAATDADVCLAAYDRDYGFGEARTLSEALNDLLDRQLPFSSREVLDAVSNFNETGRERLVTAMKDMGFPQEQIDAMCSRCNELAERLSNLNGEKKIISDDGILLTFAKKYARPSPRLLPLQYERQLLRKFFR